MRLYLRSVGRNATLLLNVPLDQRGLVPPPDSVVLMDFRRMRERLFERASDVPLERMPGVDAIWTSPADRSQSFNGIELSEDIRHGQRVAAFRVEARVDDEWTTLASGTTIGRRRILLVPSQTAAQFRVGVVSSLGAPHLRPMRLLRIPNELHQRLFTDP
jgi:alpha-L-fucosidase